MNTAALPARDEWKRHWPLVGSALAGMSFYTVISYSLGTFMEPLEKEFGWGRADISFGLTIFYAIAMIGSPLIGLFIDRHGTRRIAIGGLIVSVAAFCAFSLANGSLWQWYGLFALYGVVSLAFKPTVWSTGISGTFSTSRSLALAVVLSGSALGQSLAPLAANWLIDHHGWRTAYLGLGLGWGGLALGLVALFFFDARERSRRASLTPVRQQDLPGLTLREAARDSRIIRIAIANIAMAMMGAGVSMHLVPVIVSTGLDKGTAVAVAATAGVAGIAGKLLVGVLLDHVQGSLIPFLSFASAALAHFLLLGTFGGTTALTLGAMTLGFASGAGLQVTTYLVSRYAGLRNFGTIYSVISSMMMAGSAIGPWIAGKVYDTTGSYEMLLITAIPVVLVASLLFVGLGAYPRFGAEETRRGATPV